MNRWNIYNMKKYLVLFLIINLNALIIFSGCLESNNNNDNLLDETYQKIIGSWYNTGNIENVTIAIIYNFYSNSSYFTATIINNISKYQNSIWGKYELNKDTIFFNPTNVNISNSSLNYDFSEDFNNLIIYYEGYENYIIFTRLKSVF